MTAGTRVAIHLGVLLLLTGARAETLVQWGENPSGTGTPGTNIVSGNQVMTGVTSTYSATATNSPVVGANYYPDAAGRSPRFSASVSSTTNGGGRLVEGASSGDRLAAYAVSIPTGGTFRGMCMWSSNNFVITDRPITITNATLVSIQRQSAETTNQGLRIVVRQADSYYVSDSTNFGSVVTTQSFPLASLTWYAFTPFASGTETIGGAVATPSLVDVQAVGFYFTVQNGAALAATGGINVTCFSVEGFEDTGGTTYTLGVSPDDLQHGNASPTGGVYTSGQTVELTATASNYWQFAGWSGDLGGSTNPVTITMDADKVITATFSAILATNGTPHWWLAEHSLTTDDAGALSDDDQDGYQAWQEYLAGTLPTAATSVFRVASLNLSAPGPVLNWTGATGHLYRVSWSTNFANGFTVFADATALPAGSFSYTDTLHSAEQQLLYQLETWRE
jgi:hypothetical protein